MRNVMCSAWNRFVPGLLSVSLALTLLPQICQPARPGEAIRRNQRQRSLVGQNSRATEWRRSVGHLAMRDEIRKLKRQHGLPAGGVSVEIRGGVYELTAPLRLTAEDSGDARAAIITARQGRCGWSAWRSRFARRRRGRPQAARRVGGARSSPRIWAALGSRISGQVVGVNRMELFFQDKPMTLARWPNEGFVRIVDLVGGAPHRIHGIPGDKIGRFTYDGDRPGRWLAEKDVWLHGYWFWDWADQRQQIESIDAVRRIISLVPPYHSYGYRKDQWYYAAESAARTGCGGRVVLGSGISLTSGRRPLWIRARPGFGDPFPAGAGQGRP